MSVIAYKDGVLAADSRLTSDVILSDNAKKIFQKDGRLFGVSGDWDKVVKGIEWFKNGADLTEVPDVPFNGVLIIPGLSKEKIYLVGFGFALEIKEPFFSTGSGSSIALGAMYAGATAGEAVLAAIQFDNNCGGKVKKLYLERSNNG